MFFFFFFSVVYFSSGTLTKKENGTRALLGEIVTLLGPKNNPRPGTFRLGQNEFGRWRPTPNAQRPTARQVRTTGGQCTRRRRSASRRNFPCQESNNSAQNPGLFLHIETNMCMYVYIHIYIYITHINKHVHIYTYTCTSTD